MVFAITLVPEAIADLRRLRAHVQAEVRDATERHLRHQPTKVSKSRIKRLRGLSHPQYRLRVEDFKVFYDVTGAEVTVLASVAKPDVDAWLAEPGRP
jgi:mRNA-degrading endonuclease RelE of RelBE toxin-antitoxin system